MRDYQPLVLNNNKLKPIEEILLSHEEGQLEASSLPSQLPNHFPNRKVSGLLVPEVPRSLKPTQDAENSLHNNTQLLAEAYHYSSSRPLHHKSMKSVLVRGRTCCKCCQTFLLSMLSF